MSRWKKDKEEIKEHSVYVREWAETENGKAYKKKHAEYAKEWRKNNKDKFHASQKRNYDATKLEVLTHYSGGTPACKCCGETIIEFLTIDHIAGDGAEHRRKLEKQLGYKPGGNGVWYWAKKNGFPDSLQVLCANCNFGKRCGPECPHVKYRVSNTILQKSIQ